MQRLPNTPVHKTLLDPWRSLPASVLLGGVVFVFTLMLWMAIAGFDPSRLDRGFDLARLTRTGPWELVSMATVCVLAQLLLFSSRRLLQTDPRLGDLLIAVLLACALCLILGLVAKALSPQWVYVFGVRRIHALNGGLLASVLMVPLMFVWLIVSDMRLSALEPGRDARMRSAAASPAQGAAPVALWNRSTSWVDRAMAWYNWRLPVNAHSQLLDAFSWQRVLVRNVVEGTVFAAGTALLISVLIAVGVFGDIKAATAEAEKLEAALPVWFTEGAYFLVLGAGSWALTAVARWAKWMNHSLTATSTAIWTAHLGVAAACMVSWSGVPGIPAWLNPVVLCVSVLCALRPLDMVSDRAEAIQAAKHLAASEQAIRAEGAKTLGLADLKALQAQIEPHFLYNTLANLQLLIRQDAVRADAMAGHLIDYLRARLPMMRAPSAPLAGEFDMVRSYLEILKIRMGERLTVSFDLPEDCEAASLPPLMVMTLVENAIKHGIEPQRGGGSIHVSAKRHVDWMCIRVADTGAGFGAGTTGGTGLGLVNIRERLRLSFPLARDAQGYSARLTLLHNEPQGVVVELHMPAGLPADPQTPELRQDPLMDASQSVRLG